MIRQALAELDLPIAVIGCVVAGDGVDVVREDGSTLDTNRAGWDHFSGP